MTRRLLNLLTILSSVACAAIVALWVWSYRAAPAATIPAGRWDVESWRGQLWLFRHAPNQDPSFVRTTIHVGLAGPRPVALIKALVFDRNSPWDEKHGMPSALLSRPYVMVNLPGGVGLDNHGGFAAASGGLPAIVPGLERYAGVLHALAVPHWFAAALAGAAPLAWMRRWVASRRRPRAGLCRHCGYDLRATPDGCPECGSGREADIGRMSAVP